VADWRVFWVPRDAVRGGIRRSVLEGWEDLPAREREVDVRAGDAIFLSPDYRVDPRLSAYARSREFRSCTAETRRNYATDIRLFLDFLWSRGRGWTEAREQDLEDFEHWRRQEESNPGRIGGNKWDRETAAFLHLYKWAVKNKVVTRNPVATKQVMGRYGEVLTVAEARAKDARPSNVHWLTPRTWRRWIDVGLRGHTKDGVPESGWVGRIEDRNVAFVRLLVSSGLRRSEGGSLLTFEVPARQLDGGRYYRGKIAAAVTRSKKSRTFYVASEAIGDVEAYVDSSRAWAVRRAQRQGVYERLPELRIVTEVTRGLNPAVHWVDRNGVAGRHLLNRLPITERAMLFTDGAHGPEPLWLWLNEQGLPFHPHSWNGVFRTANQRCEAVLTPPERLRMDPHKVYAPYATVHSARHSFALYMLVVLDALMDQRFGLTPEERRDYRMLYGDPWMMVQNLLGHSSRDTTIKHYLAPVADLQLRSMLATANDDKPDRAPMAELDAVFARIAAESEGIQDIDDRLRPQDGEA
jgi:site-specific recombinase XerD